MKNRNTDADRGVSRPSNNAVFRLVNRALRVGNLASLGVDRVQVVPVNSKGSRVVVDIRGQPYVPSMNS
jgi:hypothetical protein